MFAEAIRKYTDSLIEKEIIKSEDKDITIYGLSVAVELAFNIVTTLFLGFIFGLVLESLVFLISFSVLRTYAGGYHCKTAMGCYLMSSGVVAVVLGVAKTTPQEHLFIMGMALMGLAAMVILKMAVILFLMNTSQVAYMICLGIVVSASLVVAQKKVV